MKEWNMVDSDDWSSQSFNIFKNKFSKFILPKVNAFFNCINSKGVKIITRLWLGLSHLQDHKFKHYLQDCLKPICSCGTEVETTVHYLLHCPNNLDERKSFLNNIKSVLHNILKQSDTIIDVFPFGDTSLDDTSTTIILNTTINYLTSTKRFNHSILMF